MFGLGFNLWPSIHLIICAYALPFPTPTPSDGIGLLGVCGSKKALSCVGALGDAIGVSTNPRSHLRFNDPN